MKIVCLCMCAVLLVACYGTRFFVRKITKKDVADERIVMNVKLVTLAISGVLFILTLIFVK